MNYNEKHYHNACVFLEEDPGLEFNGAGLERYGPGGWEPLSTTNLEDFVLKSMLRQGFAPQMDNIRETARMVYVILYSASTSDLAVWSG